MTQSIRFETKLIRRPIAKKSDDWHQTAFQWLVFINGQQFDYYTGSAHVFKSKHSWVEDKPKPPSLDDVLHSLVMDAEAEEMSFDDWCGNLGYDTDSRKALETYLACQHEARLLRKAGVNITAERERLADY